MYCAFCGEPIDRATMKCSACARPAPELRGGNSFQELLRRDGRTEKRNTYGLEENVPVPGPTDPARPGRGPVLAAILFSALCLLLALLLTALLRQSRRLEELDRSSRLLSEQVGQFLTELETSAPSEETPPAETLPPSATPEPAENTITAEERFRITKQPESEPAISAGHTGIALTCRAEGEGLTFQWRRYDSEDNVWLPIGEDEGLFTVESAGDFSSLSLVNAREEHTGTYICVITRADGEVLYSEPAQLKVLSAFPYLDMLPDPFSEDEDT